MNNSVSISPKDLKINEKWLVFGLLGVYLILTSIWHFLSDAPWDDDCVFRYYQAKEAISNPNAFISLWNRPLFILLFFIPFQITKHAILLMAVISAVNAYALFQVAKKLTIPNAFLIIPLLVFQAFFFTVSRNSLAEPLAAAIISLGYYFYINKKFLYFALIGSLIPLARLELSVLLIVWVYILFANNHWKYIFLLAIPTVIWSLAGTILDGDIFWLFEQTIGKGDTENRYGHTDFWHYFQRFIYVIGPFVFYFFFIGFFERLYKRKFDVFLIPQFILGFTLYVLFSWKLNMGQAAGFLRHLIVLSPLVSLLALYGYNYWLEPVTLQKNRPPALEKNKLGKKELLQKRIEEIQKRAKKQHLKSRQIRHLINQAKRKFKQANNKNIQTKKTPDKSYQKTKYIKYRILLYSSIMIGLSFLFFSRKLIMHQKISDINDYTNVFIIGGLSIVFLLLILIFRKKTMGNAIKFSMTFLLISCITLYPLLTEPPGSHYSPERKTMVSVSDLYMRSYLKNYDCYVNHAWFFWANDLSRDKKVFNLITLENLQQAPDSSIIIWEIIIVRD